MLIVEKQSNRVGLISIMSDVALLVVTVKTTLSDLARQANALGIGLQNAAPGDKLLAPNHSVQYLLSISESLLKIAKECDKLLNKENKHSLDM